MVVTGPSCCHHDERTPNREIAGQSADNYLATFPRNNPALWDVLCEWKQASHHSDDNDDDQDDTRCEWPCWSLLIGWCMDTASHWPLALVLMVTEVESSPNWRWQRAHASLLSSMESPATQWQHDNLRTIRQTPSSCLLLSSSQLSMRYRPRLSQFLTKKKSFPKRMILPERIVFFFLLMKVSSHWTVELIW